MSQQKQIVARLRELILAGDLSPGERVAEVPIASKLGVSRTPVRYALGVLAREGMVEPTPNGRGYTVRRATAQDMLDATQLRGVLEGLAARRVAETGLPRETRLILEACIEDGERVFAGNDLVIDAGTRWQDMNRRFHDAIVHAAHNAPIRHALRNNDQVPFAGAGTIIIEGGEQDISQRRFAVLLEAQRQHRAILRCLINGEGARVEALMREHCYLAIENIGLIGLLNHPIDDSEGTPTQADANAARNL